MGTQGKDEVDYNWLPASTLAAQSWCTVCTSLITPSLFTPSPHMTLSSSHSPLIPQTLLVHTFSLLIASAHHALLSLITPSLITPPLTPHMCHFMQGKAQSPHPAQGRERAANRRNVTCIRIANPSYCYFVTNNYCSHPTYIHTYVHVHLTPVHVISLSLPWQPPAELARLCWAHCQLQ